MTVALTRAGGIARLEVSDSGHGIAPEAAASLFERFWQEDGNTTRAHGGLGLGLAIARHIAERHGGSIRAESVGRGRGAAFVVELPLAGRAAPRRQSKSSVQSDRRRPRGPRSR